MTGSDPTYPCKSKVHLLLDILSIIEISMKQGVARHPSDGRRSPLDPVHQPSGGADSCEFGLVVWETCKEFTRTTGTTIKILEAS